MSFPEFFNAAPVVRLHDPLAGFLGAATDGIIDYRYRDAVRLAGHSCPTVASAFLLTRRALAALYAEALPVRGEIKVEFAEAEDSGVTGVIAAVTTLLTGATANGGFQGLAGRFNRRHKLFFSRPLSQGSVRFTRLDNGQSVEALADLSGIPGDPRTGELMRLCLSGRADAESRRLFAALWQDRVRRLLTSHADDDAVFRIFAAGDES